MPNRLKHRSLAGYTGPWGLYIFNEDGYHPDALWFTNKVGSDHWRAGEPVPAGGAKNLYDVALADGREIRITDGGDLLVHHVVAGEILHGAEFWSEVLGS